MHKEVTHAKRFGQKSIVCWPVLLGQEAMAEQVMLVRNKLAFNQLSQFLTTVHQKVS